MYTHIHTMSDVISLSPLVYIFPCTLLLITGSRNQSILPNGHHLIRNEGENDGEEEESPQPLSSRMENTTTESTPTTKNDDVPYPDHATIHASQSLPPTYTEDELQRIFASLVGSENIHYHSSERFLFI